ncbi:MAG TPA: hypothetical protein VGM41_20050 [Chitinophagaceae bacterium]|jgi:hypothetical protein
MNKFSFWHKLAFIANCCWLITWAIRYRSFLPDGNVQSTIVVTGLVLASGLNLLANLLTGFLFLRGKLPAGTPRWLLTVNFLFLLPQLYLFFR